MDEYRTEDHSAGYDAFYTQKAPRRLPNQAPTDVMGYACYMRDKRFNEGWNEAKAEYDQRTERKS